jgi:hypothetical protein
MNVHQSDQQASVQPVDDTTNHSMCTMTRPQIVFCFRALFSEGPKNLKVTHPMTIHPPISYSSNDHPSIHPSSSCLSNDHPSIPSILLANTEGGEKKEGTQFACLSKIFAPIFGLTGGFTQREQYLLDVGKTLPGLKIYHNSASPIH